MGYIQRRNILEILTKQLSGQAGKYKATNCDVSESRKLPWTEQSNLKSNWLCSVVLAWNVVVDDVDVDGAAGVDLLVGVDVEPALGCNSIDILGRP